eukprot:Sspe_Gene.59042::Locus_32425_Transcript_1_1_Confidence_1.000_Length_2671::g.59042::m.59042/K15426/PPP4R4; serine/threonine-protein phosphatase 4 regulatory subunit 4
MPRGSKNVDPFYTQELPALDGLNAVNATCKQEESVCKYIEDNHLSSGQRALYILEKGSDVQRTAVLEQLRSTWSEWTEKEASNFLAALNEYMWQLEVQIQLAGATAMLDTLPIMGSDLVVQLVGLVQTMMQLKEDRIRDAWGEVLVACVDCLPQEGVEEMMLTMALKMGELSEPLHSRTMCCRLLGKIAQRSPGRDFVIDKFLGKAMSLCQDTDFVVREAMCMQLNSTARAIGLEQTKEVLIDELFELLRDEHPTVSRAAFATLIDLVDYFDVAYRTEKLYPIIRGYINNPPDPVRPLLTEEYGKCVWAIKHDIETAGEEDVNLFAKFYYTLSQSGDPKSRHMCAINLPAVVASLPLSAFPTHLLPVIKGLSEDDHVDTRVSIAAGLHEISNLLSDHSFLYLKDPFLVLIQDEEPVVRTKLIANLSTILDAFQQQLPDEDKEKFFTQIIQPIVDWWDRSRNSCHKQEMLVDHLPSFPSYFTQGQLHTTFLPLLLTQLSVGPRVLADRFASLVILFTRRLNNANLEIDLFTKFVNDFGRSRSYWNRLAYIDLCRHTISHYSRKFVRDHVLLTFLDLAKDPVSNVRRKVCTLLPVLKPVLRPPADVDLVAGYLQVTAMLQLDTNRDVVEAIQAAAVEMDGVDRELQRQQALQTVTDEDRLDAEREANELALLEVAREQDKIERRQKIREMLLTEKQEKAQDRKPKRTLSSEPRLPPTSATRVTRTNPPTSRQSPFSVSLPPAVDKKRGTSKPSVKR